MLEKAAISPTIEERTKYYEKIQDKLKEDSPIIPLLQGKLFVVAKKDVKGVILDPTMIFRYYLLE
jgi:peptide/nickel transport system substrate-binding protein